MTPLVPESRVNKNGVPVIKHVRVDEKRQPSSVLSRILPAIGLSRRASDKGHRAEIMGALASRLEAEKIDSDQAALEHLKEEPDSFRKQRLTIQYERLKHYADHGPSHADRLITKLQSYSLDTLDRLVEASTETPDLTSLLTDAPDDETNFRAFLNFRDCMLSAYPNLVINDVRDSTGIDDLAELEPGSGVHTLVSAVINVASLSHNHRAAAHYAREREARNYYVSRIRPSWHEQQSTVIKMTPELAKVIVDNPDRVDDIIAYMSERDIIPEDVDCDHLRLHLENASSALSSGIL